MMRGCCWWLLKDQDQIVDRRESHHMKRKIGFDLYRLLKLIQQVLA
jgi:hypothetical protein